MTDFQIECFLNVAKYLNFTEAANHLFIAQSSLSRNISNLENELGIRLFSRTKKYVRLTPGGAVLYQEFSHLRELACAAIEKAKRASLGEEGEIRLGVIETQRSENFLPKALEALRSRHPNIQVHLIRGNFKELRDALMNGSIDISLTLDLDLSEYPSSETISQPFFRSSARCVVSTSHPLANQEEIDLEELQNETIIAISPDISRGAYDNLIRLCGIYGYNPSKIAYSRSIQDTLLMVESGLGFSVLDQNCISSSNSAIQSIPIRRSNPMYIVAVWKKENFNPVIPLFISLLVSESDCDDI